MSLFNLDRFRFDKTNGEKRSTSPVGEADEKKPSAKDRPATPVLDPETKAIPETPEAKMLSSSIFIKEKKVRFQGLDSEDEDLETEKGPGERKENECNMDQEIKINGDANCSPEKTDDEKPDLDSDPVNGAGHSSTQETFTNEQKLQKLQEIFPQKTEDELLKLVKTTSTLEGAVATGLIIFDNASTRKRKIDSSPSSSFQNRNDEQCTKRKKSDLSSSSSSHESDEDQTPRPRKKTKSKKLDLVRNSDASDDEDHTKKNESDGSDDEDHTKRNGSDTSSSNDGSKNGSDSELDIDKQEADLKKLQLHFPDLDKEELREVLQEHDWSFNEALEALKLFAEDEEDHFPKSSQKRGSASQKNRTDSKGKLKQKSEREQNGFSKNQKGRAGFWNIRSERKLSESEESSSDNEGSLDGDYSSGEETMDDTYKDKIVSFLQDATLDELSLIPQCSQKKAQKIIELRPFNSWDSLNSKLSNTNGLPDSFVWDCKTLIKEREVVLRLMTKCENISNKLTKQVTKITEDGESGWSVKPPSILSESLELKPYQKIGLNWLALLNKHKVNGILADEMGLGKTVQAISFLAYLYMEGYKGPHLVIVPASTLDNWIREFNQWCPELKVILYYGSQEDRKYLRYDILSNKLEFEEHKKEHDSTGNASPQSKSGNKKEKKRNQGKDKPPTVALKDFQSETNTDQLNKKQEELRSPSLLLPDGEFFNRLEDDVSKILIREKRREHTDVNGVETFTSHEYSPERFLKDGKTEQLKVELEKKNEEMKQIQKVVKQWEGKYKEVKARNAQLLKMLQEGEMKDKADILLQVDELLTIKNELTLQVTGLHVALEQERSKVKGLQAELLKYQGGKKGKRNAEAETCR